MNSDLLDCVVCFCRLILCLFCDLLVVVPASKGLITPVAAKANTMSLSRTSA